MPIKYYLLFEPDKTLRIVPPTQLYPNIETIRVDRTNLIEVMINLAKRKTSAHLICSFGAHIELERTKGVTI